MNSVVLILSALLTFAYWVDAKTIIPFPSETCTQETYTGKNGTIDFPGEGNNYNNSLNCLFKISVPEDHLVQFKFSRFDFELVGDGTKCDESYDWLRFIDGNDVNDETTDFCNSGPGANKSYSSTNNEITLWMYSDNAAGGKGFKLDWTSVEPEPDCECNDIGTDKKTCKNETEKCKCKPSYTGEKCEKCSGDYWMSSSECKKCNVCNNCPEPNKIGTCNKSNGECECTSGSSATFAFNKTIVLFPAFLIFVLHQY